MFCLEDNVDKPCLITPWSFIHFISSITFYLFINLFIKNNFTIFITTLIVHTIYEIKDIYFAYFLKIYEYNNKFLNHWGNNSILNSVGDTLACIIGCLTIYLIKNKYNKKQLLLLSSIITIIFFCIFCYNELG